MDINRVTWWGTYNPQALQYELFAVRRHQDGRNAITFECTETPIKPTQAVMTGPTLPLKEDEAQSLFQALWDAGLRPRDGHGAVAHTHAMSVHLEDMRKIAFDSLGIKL